LGIYSTALFPETISVLDKLKKSGFKLGVYSQGFTSLQKIKIESSGIKDYFDENFIFISRDKTDPKFVATLPNGATIVDDKEEEVVRPLNTTGRFDVVWMNRKNGERISDVTTVEDLNEFANYMISGRKMVS
jgi:FMN phosphatase YigB (HAD superfamily)